LANEVQILTPALETALEAWAVWKKGKSLLEHYSIGAGILDPLAAAIEACDVYKNTAGKPIFSGYSGVVIFGSTLAAPLLYRAEPEYGMGILGAIEWFKKILTTTKATGSYAVAIWGMKLDKAVEIADGCLVQPYEAAPDLPIKRRINDLTRRGWDGAVWHSARFYDVPGAIMTRTVNNFPYLGRPDLSFKELDRLDGDTKDLLAFLQASVTGNPLVGASWFSYEDDELDFNSHENHLSWCVPEVEPIVRTEIAQGFEFRAASEKSMGNASRLTSDSPSASLRLFDGLAAPRGRVKLSRFEAGRLNRYRSAPPDNWTPSVRVMPVVSMGDLAPSPSECARIAQDERENGGGTHSDDQDQHIHEVHSVPFRSRVGPPRRCARPIPLCRLLLRRRPTSREFHSWFRSAAAHWGFGRTSAPAITRRRLPYYRSLGTPAPAIKPCRCRSRARAARQLSPSRELGPPQPRPHHASPRALLCAAGEGHHHRNAGRWQNLDGGQPQ
jgi:hypothetical protein